jgi:hypothetical protein
MISALRLPLRFDPDRLRNELALVAADDWTPHYNATDYGGTWRGAALRSGSGSTRDLNAMPPSGAGFIATPLLDRCAYFREVLSAFPCPIRSVRLLGLAAGSFIREHVDHALDYEDGLVRIHIPVQTNPAVEFFLSGERIALEEGLAYYLNVNLPHRVNNRGGTERIHLVIDADVNLWIVDLFARSENAPVCAPSGPGLPAFRDIVMGDAEMRETLRKTDDAREFADAAQRLGRAAGFAFHEGDLDAFVRGPSQPGEPGGLPIGFTVRDGAPYVEWIDIGDRTLSEPLFEDTLRVCMRNPYVRFSRREAPLSRMEAAPLGFIFHMSRCGSTLAARMFSAAGIRVISEAAPIDQAVHAGRVEWLRWLVSALGGGRPYVVKLDSWHIHSLPLIRAAFPSTPWIFLYRDPLEVLISHQRSPGKQSLPGLMEPGILGMPAEAAFLPRDEWGAQVLAALCRSALAHVDQAGLLVDYCELPDAVPGSIARHFGITMDDAARRSMNEIARFDAKSPWALFEPGPVGKQAGAHPLIEVVARAGLDRLYGELRNS